MFSGSVAMCLSVCVAFGNWFLSLVQSYIYACVTFVDAVIAMLSRK